MQSVIINKIVPFKVRSKALLTYLSRTNSLTIFDVNTCRSNSLFATWLLKTKLPTISEEKNSLVILYNENNQKKEYIIQIIRFMLIEG